MPASLLKPSDQGGIWMSLLHHTNPRHDRNARMIIMNPITRPSLWGMPILLAVLILFGLLAALLGTGIWHGLSWLALTIPVLVCLRFALWPRGT